MTAKREVWVVEDSAAPVADEHGSIEAYTHERGAEKCIEYVVPWGKAVRYVPEPQPVVGWPAQDGWYWAWHPDANPGLVRYAYGRVVSYPPGVELTPSAYPDLRFWGPLVAPEPPTK